MENQKSFRRAVIGFNRSDVLRYISELSAMIDRLKKEQEREIADYENEISKLKEKLSEVEYAATTHKKENEELRAGLSELQKRSSGISNEYVNIKRSLEGKINEFVALERKVNELTEQNASLAEKAALYDAGAKAIGDVMLRARQDADRITENAIKNAAVVRGSIEKEVKAASGAVSDISAQFGSTKGKVANELETLMSRLSDAGENISFVERQFKTMEHNFCSDKEEDFKWNEE